MLIFVGLLFPLSSAMAAGNGDSPWEKYSVSLGGFLTTLDSSIRVGSDSLGAGIEVDLESGLGLESSTTVFRLDTLGRFGNNQRHRVDFSYFYYNRNATKAIQQDIEYNDIIFSAGDVVDSTFNIQIYKLNYGYSLIMDDRVNLSLGLGLYVMPIETSLSLQGGGNSSSEDVTAPLPSMSLRLDFALTEKSYIRQGLDVFYLEYGDFRGGMIGLSIAYEYRLSKNFGLGIGFDSMKIKLEAKGSDYPGIDLIGDIEFGYSGLMFFGKYYF